MLRPRHTRRALLRRTVALAALGAVATPAAAMRCGNRLVGIGDRSSKVRRLCGEPLQIDTHSEVVEVGVQDPVSGAFASHSVLVEVELWTYDRGPRRLVTELRFENGRLVDSESLGYGER